MNKILSLCVVLLGNAAMFAQEVCSLVAAVSVSHACSIRSTAASLLL